MSDTSEKDVTTLEPVPTEGRPAVPPVIESASATTSPDNERSGPFAYILTAVVVAVLALLVMGFSGCVTSLGTLASAPGSYWEYTYDPYFSDDPYVFNYDYDFDF